MAIMQEFTFLSSDGTHQIHGMEWLPENGAPKAVVQLVHGISEYIGRYDHFARFLTEHGYAVVGHDHLGHGKTAVDRSEYGFFAEKDGWKHVLRDTRTWRELSGKRHPGLPYFLMGHSMGSFVVRGYLMVHPNTVDAAILSGTGQEPAVRVGMGRMISALIARVKGPRCQSPLMNALSMGSYNKQFSPTRTKADWISRDEAVVDAYIQDPLCRFLPTVGMYHDMMLGLQFLVKKENLSRLCPDTPVYLFAGDKDPVGNSGVWVQQVADWFTQYGVKDVTVKLYPDGRHEMLNEINRDEVFRDTLDWIEARYAQMQAPAGTAAE